MKIALISPYELGRQPFGLAEPAALLKNAGFDVTCIDLSIQKLDEAIVREADLIGLYLAMHTATRIGIAALEKIRRLSPNVPICAYGLYAPPNEDVLRDLGVSWIYGGEFEPLLLDLAESIRNNQDPPNSKNAIINLKKIEFFKPDRASLPTLSNYASLISPEGEEKTVGFVEASRGCKHICSHCPIVPIYEGKFRIVPVDIVMADIRQQIALGAQHISFGDPDFLNGPTHATKIVEQMAKEYPDITYDATIKIQHLLKHKELLPKLKSTGCLFVTSAVESIDDHVLDLLKKNHTNKDFGNTVALMRQVGIAFAPTFVAFHPWISLEGYIELLRRLIELRLVESVPPIQLAIRLLIPKGSHLMQIESITKQVTSFDPKSLNYQWKHNDPAVDKLQEEIERIVEDGEKNELTRRATFHRIWTQAHMAIGKPAPELPDSLGEPIHRHSEPWYCCAEPTSEQLMNF